MSYTTYDISSREKTGDIITLSQFEEGKLLSETRHGMEIVNQYDENSTLAPLISEEEMDQMSSGDESDDELTVLEEINDGSQYHLSINSRYARYKILDCIKQGQAE